MKTELAQKLARLFVAVYFSLSIHHIQYSYILT